MKMEEQHARKMKCVEMANAGMNFEEIGEALGLSKDSVRQTCAKYGIRRHKKSDERLLSERLLLNGMDDEYVALILGKNEWCISKIRRELGLKKKNGHSDDCAKRRSEIIEYRRSGHTIKETASVFSVGEQYVKQACSGLYIGYADGKGPRLTDSEREELGKKLIKERWPDWEYVDGYTSSSAKSVRIKCKKCGNIETKSACKLRQNDVSRNCPVCSRPVIRYTLRIDTFLKHWEAEERRKNKPNKQKSNVKTRKMHNCAVCGKLTSRPKYCSRECARKVQNTNQEIKKRMFAKSKTVDKDITLQKLFLRDQGKCWICGMLCDYHDFKRTERAFIAGDLYPSIDHIMPKCEGGEHSWQNVRLAHRKCNADRYVRERKDSTKKHLAV